MRAFVLVNEAVSDNTELNADKWCKQIVRVLNSEFNIKIAFGGNAADYDVKPVLSLDEIFLPHDVAKLAKLSYDSAITDSSFFHDDDLVASYFKHTTNPTVFFNITTYFNLTSLV